MRPLFNLLTFFLTIAVFLGSAFVVLTKLFSSITFAPESKAWNTLVPWDTEMMGLLSLNQINIKKRGWFDSTFSGTFTTIYHEPVLAYAGLRSGSTGVLVARTSDREFIFRDKGKETEIWINSQPFGLFVDGNLISAGRSNNLLAQMGQDADDSQLPVLLTNNTSAAITNPDKISSPNPRALTLLRNLSAEEENALLALTLLKIIQ
jgi:hypothetical protein